MLDVSVPLPHASHSTHTSPVANVQELLTLTETLWVSDLERGHPHILRWVVPIPNRQNAQVENTLGAPSDDAGAENLPSGLEHRTYEQTPRGRLARGQRQKSSLNGPMSSQSFPEGTGLCPHGPVQPEAAFSPTAIGAHPLERPQAQGVALRATARVTPCALNMF